MFYLVTTEDCAKFRSITTLLDWHGPGLTRSYSYYLTPQKPILLWTWTPILNLRWKIKALPISLLGWSCMTHRFIDFLSVCLSVNVKKKLPKMVIFWEKIDKKYFFNFLMIYTKISQNDTLSKTIKVYNPLPQGGQVKCS